MGPLRLMKTTDAAEVVNGAHGEMKSQNASQRPSGSGRRSPPMRIPQIPMEWMDPMSWRLPSGKALAEFALQAGFLAPLMLSSTGIKKRRKASAAPADAVVVKRFEKHAGEGPEDSGSFRSPGVGPKH